MEIKNGKGKEYNMFNGELIFEGDYINGIRNNQIHYLDI